MGVCEDGPGGFTCNCPVGLQGERCEIDEDNCASGPCWNEATCVDDVNGFTYVILLPEISLHVLIGGNKC